MNDTESTQQAGSAAQAGPTPETEHARSDMPRIVVGVDGSEPSIAALRRADRMARALGTEVEAVTTWSYPLALSPYALSSGPSFEQIAHETQEAALTEAFGSDRPSLLITTVEQGHAASVLIDRSADAEMLVLGSRGHGGFAGLLLGSVSSECAAHARCPVLIIH